MPLSIRRNCRTHWEFGSLLPCHTSCKWISYFLMLGFLVMLRNIAACCLNTPWHSQVSLVPLVTPFGKNRPRECTWWFWLVLPEVCWTWRTVLLLLAKQKLTSGKGNLDHDWHELCFWIKCTIPLQWITGPLTSSSLSSLKISSWGSVAKNSDMGRSTEMCEISGQTLVKFTRCTVAWEDIVV